MSRGKRHRKIRAQHKWEKRHATRIIPSGKDCTLDFVMTWKPFPATCHVGERLHADGSCEYSEEKKQ